MKKIEVAILDKTYSLMTDESEVVLKEALEICNNALHTVLAKSEMCIRDRNKGI